jgi:tetratricopeptide (TPR) repeat protein
MIESHLFESHGLSEHLFGLAEDAANHGEYTKALKYLEQVLIMNPKHCGAWRVKGICLYNLGKCEEPLHSYDFDR